MKSDHSHFRLKMDWVSDGWDDAGAEAEQEIGVEYAVG